MCMFKGHYNIPFKISSTQQGNSSLATIYIMQTESEPTHIYQPKAWLLMHSMAYNNWISCDDEISTLKITERYSDQETWDLHCNLVMQSWTAR